MKSFICLLRVFEAEILTNDGSDIVNWVRFPKLLLYGSEAKLGENERGYKGLEMWLQQGPC